MLAYLVAALATFRRWRQRARTRRELRMVEDWQLADIGRTKRDRAHEGAKPFWQG